MSRAPSDPAIASPRTTRSTSTSERRPLAPVTPQRTARPYKLRAVTSPLTPSNSSSISSPFTPITNIYSSASSLVSPGSSVSTKVEYSPEAAKAKAKSVADATGNWRSRTKENGAKADNEGYPDADTLSFSADSIPVSFLSTHRRSRQSMFQTNSSDSTSFISPQTARMAVVDGDTAAPAFPGSDLPSLLGTPEAARSLSGSFSLTTPSPRSSLAIVQRLRQRGSLTDPVRPRRRQLSGPVMGEALFDIDEDAPTTSPYPQTFGSPFSATTRFESPSNTSKRCVSAPFIAGRFYENYDNDDGDDEYEDDGLSNAPMSSQLRNIRSISSLSAPASAKDNSTEYKSEITDEKTCSVCSASSSPLSILVPCEHLICSSCLTGALNIIGEKDMRCASCDKPVDDFRLLSPLKINSAISEEAEEGKKNDSKEVHKEETISLLPSAFEDLSIKTDGTKNKVKFGTDSQSQNGPDTPYASCEIEDVTVLRIDNVPWDITPPTLVEFFTPYTAVRAHVLLDPKGKTLSHAYVEVPASDARNALRAVQNKSLGKGRRLRGVTVTMSSQGELMRALFPSWLGGFDGTHPTLDGLDHPSVVRTLENGLITLPEIDGLVALMKNPKSHFLKVPTLPFYTLVSILSKFPADSDSRVFYSGKLRDVLYGSFFWSLTWYYLLTLFLVASTELTNAACDLLVERVNSSLHDQRTLDTVVSTAVNSRDFQRSALNDRIINAIATKGGQLTCTPPKFQRSLSTSSVLSPQSEESITPEDSASSVSRSSGHDSRDQRNLGYGRPTMMGRRNNNTFAFANASPFVNSQQALYAALASSHINSSPGFGFGNVNMGLGMPFAMNGMSQNPMTQSPYNVLAREFGVKPDLVAALAQRLAYTSQNAMPSQPIGSYAYANGRM
ncbi:hypothetical protein EW145_g2885 [Phellinidium pouzarii]|uniref:RING-type domain-containing protein n=1 Tax=Phellinidium pouzarii TaxID=167371 RepID=A0A4S4L9E3_9AGAM|nr:hypothetical protein EW145_g2885 [Phellinidium pouzarii]